MNVQQCDTTSEGYWKMCHEKIEEEMSKSWVFWSAEGFQLGQVLEKRKSGFIVEQRQGILVKDVEKSPNHFRGHMMSLERLRI